MQKGKEQNDFQRNLLDIEILSNLRFGSIEIRDTSVTRVTNNVHCSHNGLGLMEVSRLSVAGKLALLGNTGKILN